MTNKLYRISVLFLIMGAIVLSSQTQLAQAGDPSALLDKPAEHGQRSAEAVCALLTPEQSHIYLPLIAVPTNSNAPTPDPLTRELSYEVGKTYTYEYEMQTSSIFGTTDENGVNKGEPNISVSVGKANIAITGMVDSDTFIGEIVLADANVCQQNGDGEDSFVEDEATLKDWQTPVIFHQRKDGVITLIKVADSVDPINANIQKSVINSLQATLKDDDSYGAIESGLQGKYLAEYKANLQNEGVAFTKLLDQNSFTEFYNQGDDPVILLNNTIRIYLGRESKVFDSVSYSEYVDVLPESETLEEEFDGVAIWGETKSNGNLRLIEVKNTGQARRADQTALLYEVASLGITLGEILTPTHGIDIAEIDMDAELDAFEAGIADPSKFARMTWVVAADDANPAGSVAPSKIEARILNNLANEAIARGYIDLLGHAQTTDAETLLLKLIDPDSPISAGIPDSLKTQVFSNIPRLKAPTSNTVNILTKMMDLGALPVEQKSMATMALGTTISSRNDDCVLHPNNCSNGAQASFSQLSDKLGKAGTDSEKVILIRALGNSASSDILPLIKPFLASENFEIQWAAYWAMRDLPGKEVEDLYLAAFDNDPEGSPPAPEVKPGVAQILKNKPGKPSDGIIDVLNNHYGPVAEGGSIAKEWGPKFGNATVGGSLPGDFLMSSPPDAERVTASAHQYINYHIKLDKINIDKQGTAAQAHAWTKPKDEATQRFGYSYSVLGKDIDVVEKDVACSYTKSNNVIKGHTQLFKTSFSYPVYLGISVSANMEAFINYSLDYQLDLELCNAGVMESSVSLTGHADAHAAASLTVDLLKAVRGGVEAAVDIVDVTASGNLKGTYHFQDGFEVCFSLPLDFEVLNIEFFLFAERYKIIDKDWKRFLEESIYKSDSIVDKDYTLFGTCWSPE